MKIAVDTNVFVAAYRAEHVHHGPSMALFRTMSSLHTYISSHVLAEFYSIMTGGPRGRELPPQYAMLCLQTLDALVNVVTLNTEDYLRAMERIAALGGMGGIVYDALHLEAARKAGVEVLYTWNVRHFERLNTESDLRILTPAEAYVE